MLVVVADVVDDDSFELRSVPYEGAVKEFASQGADPPFCEGIRYWGPHRGLQHVDDFGAKDLVERSGELASSVSD